MIRLEEKYDQALQFRKRGFTYSEIAKIVGVSKSTVSNWCAKKAFSKKVRTENMARAARDNVKRIGLVNKARSAERKNRYTEAVRSAETEYKHYREDTAFVAGLVAYMCHGDLQDSKPIRLSTSHEAIHNLFLNFMQSYLGVEKSSVHFWLLLYMGTQEKKAMNAWSKRLKVSGSQFYKTQHVSQKANGKALHNGIGNTIIGNTVLKKKLIRWIELFSKEQ